MGNFCGLLSFETVCLTGEKKMKAKGVEPHKSAVSFWSSLPSMEGSQATFVVKRTENPAGLGPSGFRCASKLAFALRGSKFHFGFAILGLREIGQPVQHHPEKANSPRALSVGESAARSQWHAGYRGESTALLARQRAKLPALEPRFGNRQSHSTPTNMKKSKM